MGRQIWALPPVSLLVNLAIRCFPFSKVIATLSASLWVRQQVLCSVTIFAIIKNTMLAFVYTYFVHSSDCFLSMCLEREPQKNIKPFFFVFFAFSRAAPSGYGGSQARGSNRSCSCQPTPEPQQLRIRAKSATYTTAHSNARSLTHWARPGIKPATSWFLVGFVSAEP